MKPEQATWLSPNQPPAPANRLRALDTPTVPVSTARQLWLAVYLPKFTLEMATRGNAERKACVLVEGASGRQRISLVNTEAARLGVKPGMALAAAHALGELRPFERVPEAESRALEQLCAWAYQFTPVVAPVAPDGLVMEIRGSLGIFGGLSGLLGKVRRELLQLGFRAFALGVAPTPTAATWLARAHQSTPVETLAALPSAFGRVPLEALQLPPQLQQDLRGIGIHTAGDCLRLPRDSFARRFGPELLASLDKALGRVPDLRPSLRLPVTFFGRIDLLWEIRHVQALSLAMERLLAELVGVLRGQSAAVRNIRWHLFHADGSIAGHTVSLVAPTRDPLHLLRLSREHFLRQPLPAPITGLALEVGDFEVQAAVPAEDLFSQRPTAGDGARDWPRFVDRLRARLGDDALQRVLVHAEHRPENAGVTQPMAITATTSVRPQESATRWPARPVWLVRQPIPLAQTGELPDFDGPLQLEPERERIQSGWWDGQAVARDYFVARDQHGSKLWVFQELAGRRGWYLHGIFD